MKYRDAIHDVAKHLREIAADLENENANCDVLVRASDCCYRASDYLMQLSEELHSQSKDDFTGYG